MSIENPVNLEDHSQHASEMIGNNPPQVNEVRQSTSVAGSDNSARNFTPQAGVEGGSFLYTDDPVNDALVFSDDVFHQRDAALIQFWDKEPVDGDEYAVSTLTEEDLKKSFISNEQVKREAIAYFCKMLSDDDRNMKTKFNRGDRVFLHTNLTNELTCGEEGNGSIFNRGRVLSYLNESLEEICNAKYIFLPFLYLNHWTVYCLDMYKCMIIVFDPSNKGSDYHNITNNALHRLWLELWSIWNEVPAFFGWKKQYVHQTERQSSSGDSGILVMKHLECWNEIDISEYLNLDKVQEYRSQYLQRMVYHDCNILRDRNSHRLKDVVGVSSAEVDYGIPMNKDLEPASTTAALASMEIAYLSTILSLDDNSKTSLRDQIFEKKHVNFVRFADLARYNPREYCAVVFNGEKLEASFGDNKQVEKDVIACLSKIISHEASPRGSKFILHTELTEHLIHKEYNQDANQANTVLQFLMASLHEIRKADLIFIPLLYGIHWTVICLNMTKSNRVIFDSLNRKSNEHAEIALSRLLVELKKIWNRVPDFVEWPNLFYEIPLQVGLNDCGILMMKCIEYWKGGTAFTKEIDAKEAHKYRVQDFYRLIFDQCNMLSKTVRSLLQNMVPISINQGRVESSSAAVEYLQEESNRG